MTMKHCVFGPKNFPANPNGSQLTKNLRPGGLTTRSPFWFWWTPLISDWWSLRKLLISGNFHFLTPICSGSAILEEGQFKWDQYFKTSPYMHHMTCFYHVGHKLPDFPSFFHIPWCSDHVPRYSPWFQISRTMVFPWLSHHFPTIFSMICLEETSPSCRSSERGSRRARRRRPFFGKCGWKIIILSGIKWLNGEFHAIHEGFMVPWCDFSIERYRAMVVR